MDIIKNYNNDRFSTTPQQYKEPLKNIERVVLNAAYMTECSPVIMLGELLNNKDLFYNIYFNRCGMDEASRKLAIDSAYSVFHNDFANAENNNGYIMSELFALLVWANKHHYNYDEFVQSCNRNGIWLYLAIYGRKMGMSEPADNAVDIDNWIAGEAHRYW